MTPADPILIFLGDGTGWVVRRSRKYSKASVVYEELLITPMDWTRRMLSLQDSDIDYNIHPEGVQIRNIISSYIIHASDNPEMPIWVCFTTSQGKTMMADNMQCAQFTKLMDANKILQEKVNVLQLEVEKAHDEMFALLSRSNDQRNLLREFLGYGSKENIRIPAEMLGIKKIADDNK